MNAAIVKELKEICGTEDVTDSPVDLMAYRLAGTPASQIFFSDLRVAPDVVVLPGSAEEVSRIISLANKYKVPVTARGQSTNCEGPNIPLQGGILLDTSFMNKVVEIDEENMVAIVESGCTTNSLFTALDERGLAFPIRPWFDPHMQVGAWVSSNGNGDFSNLYGIAPQQVVGLEVALPTGEIVRLGSWAYPHGYGAWNRFAGGPDLIGLFCGSIGTFGIITKVALRLIKKRKHIWYRALGWPREQARDMAMAMYEYFNYGVHNIGLHNFWCYRDTPGMIEQLKSDNVYFVVNLNQVVQDEEELRLKEKHLLEIASRNKGLDLGEAFCKTPLGPPHYTFNLKNLKGKSRPVVDGEQIRRGHSGMATILFYSYVPVLKFPDFWDMYEELARKYGLLTDQRGPQLFCFGIPPCALNPFPVLPFAVKDPDEVNRGRQFYRELQRNFLDQGGNPYCIGAVWPKEVLANQGNAYELIKKLKGVLDPNNILNPGQIKLD